MSRSEVLTLSTGSSVYVAVAEGNEEEVGEPVAEGRAEALAELVAGAERVPRAVGRVAEPRGEDVELPLADCEEERVWLLESLSKAELEAEGEAVPERAALNEKDGEGVLERDCEALALPQEVDDTDGEWEAVLEPEWDVEVVSDPQADGVTECEAESELATDTVLLTSPLLELVSEWLTDTEPLGEPETETELEPDVEKVAE